MFGAAEAHKYVNGVLDKVVGTSRSAEMRALSRG
jgi:transcription termination factor NusB